MYLITGVLKYVSLALLVVGSLAAHLPNEHKEENKLEFLGKKWVVLVSGSDGWRRGYRHQVSVDSFDLINIFVFI